MKICLVTGDETAFLHRVSAYHYIGNRTLPVSSDALAQNVRIPRLVREKHRIPVALKLNNDTQFLKKPILFDDAAAERRR